MQQVSHLAVPRLAVGGVPHIADDGLGFSEGAEQRQHCLEAQGTTVKTPTFLSDVWVWMFVGEILATSLGFKVGFVVEWVLSCEANVFRSSTAPVCLAFSSMTQENDSQMFTNVL